MNPIFHARIPVGIYFALILLTTGCVIALWHKLPVFVVILMLCMVFTIERIIHTTYTLTDDMLIVSRGRFTHRKNIPLSAIRRIEKCRIVRLGRYSLMSYLLIVYDTDEKFLSVMPVKEDEFLEKLTQRRRKPANSGATACEADPNPTSTEAEHRTDQTSLAR